MKYRIVEINTPEFSGTGENEVIYQIQSRLWWLPFWRTRLWDNPRGRGRNTITPDVEEARRLLKTIVGQDEDERIQRQQEYRKVIE